MIGHVLDGRYRLDRKVGVGAFGCVYKGYDQNLEREVAVKLLDRSGPGSGTRLEMQSLARLNHPGIVTIFDAGEYEGRPYAVMEFIDGVPLHDLVESAGLPLAEVLRLSLQICDAMAYAHAQGVVHRDLTLKNVMVPRGEGGPMHVKILDFGLAKLLRDPNQTSGKDMKGTLRYMSPEQIRGERVDERTDVFAFGVCLFRLLNGRYPFESEHPTAVMYQILNEPEIVFAPQMPEGLKDLVRRCLEKDPRNRPRGFAELVAELEGALGEDDGAGAGEPAATFAAIIPKRARSSKRNPYLNRAMIRNPADFFGREREIRKIYSRLDAPHPQSISIVGDRRIGKSSLLNRVYQRSLRKAHMTNYRNAVFAYLDFQGSAEFTVPKFVGFLYDVFRYDTGITIKHGPHGDTLDQLRETVRELHERGQRVVVLMDEFEAITCNPNFDTGFFSFLRALANNYRVAYVTSSHSDLQRMCHDKAISDSPFFNIFSNLPLRPFAEDEARELIAVPSAAEGLPLEPYADRLLALAGLFPLHLQIACSGLFENLLEDPDAGPDWDRVERLYVDEALPHFEFVWERLDASEQKNLGRIATGSRTNRRYEFVNEDLLRRGYLRMTGAGYVPYSTAFGDFVRRRAAGTEPRRLRLPGFLRGRGPGRA